MSGDAAPPGTAPPRLTPVKPRSLPCRLLRALLVWLVIVPLLAFPLALALPAGRADQLFFYYPDRNLTRTPADFGLRFEDVTIESAGGVRLHGWFIPATTSVVGTVVHCHGTRGCVSEHLPQTAWLPARGFNVLMFDYRGYGRSEGRPRLADVHQDCLAAYRYACSRPEALPRRAFLFGQSLGTAHALAVAASGVADPPRAIVIESPFHSCRRLVREKLGRMPVIRWLRGPLAVIAIRDDFSPSQTLPKVSQTPVLMISGTGDKVFPPAQVSDLARVAGGNVESWVIPGVGHIGALAALGETYRERVSAFLRAATEHE
jgi:fermentation-respiration switch protein FrsA (DUF1100 family)